MSTAAVTNGQRRRGIGVGQWPARQVGVLTSLAVGLVVLAPVLFCPGFVLHYDMVFVPKLPLSASTLGLDGNVPRAVPNDVVVALLDVVLPGWVTQRVILLGAFVVIGLGVDRWRTGVLTRAVAAIALTWNPWMAERLAIGHWGYLWGYAGLVWAVVGALERRGDGPGSHARATMLVGLVLSALSGSTGAVLVAIALAVLLGAPGRHRVGPARLAAGAVLWAALNAAWWFPFVTMASSAADSAGLDAFAARADTPLGTFGSLLSGGGIWHQPSWFSERHSLVIALVAAGLSVAGTAALMMRTRLVIPLSVMAAIGVLLAGARSVPALEPGLVWALHHAPGGGLLRDGQKFVALWVVPAALGIGVLANMCVRRFAGTLLAPAGLLACAALPVVTLPGFAWAHAGAWASVNYPAETTQVARQISGAPAAVMPWTLYRRYAWNGERVVLDPWQRLSSSPVLVNDDLPLREGVVRGENADSVAVRVALDAHDDAALARALDAAHVRYVIVEKDQPQSASAWVPPRARLVHDGPLLTVWERPGHVPPPTGRPAWAAAGLVTTALATIVCALLAGGWTKRANPLRTRLHTSSGEDRG